MKGNDYDALRELIAQNAIARNLGVTPQAVNQWFSKEQFLLVSSCVYVKLWNGKLLLMG